VAVTINKITATISPVATPGIPLDLATALELAVDASLLAEGECEGVTDAAAGVVYTATGVALDEVDGVREGVLELEGVVEVEEEVINDV